ncbi:MAG: HAMP domain-containing protein, partial [Acidobacteriota bacterium]
PDGQVVARTDLRGGESTLADTALFQAAIEGELYTADGIWVKDGGLFYAVLVPLVSSGVLEGCFIASYAIDDAAALELRQVTGTEVSFLTSKAAGEPLDVVATTLDPAMVEELVAWIQGVTSPEPTDVTLGRDRYLATVRPVFNVGGQEVGRVVNLGSLEQALAPFDRIGQVLLIVGFVAVLLALVASFLLPRRLLDPVRNLADAADAAADGRLDVEITGTERRDEVGRLARAFQGLLSELREQRDMQLYLTELTRTLPDADKSSGGETVPAKAETTTVLGVELQGYGQRIRTADPGVSIDGLSRDLRRISRLVASQGGSLETAAGHRLLIRFTGDRHGQRALT